MNTVDTRDLSKERDDLKEQILDAFNERFNKEVSYFEDITDEEDTDDEDFEEFKADWENEYEQIEEIDDLENEIGNEFEHGVTLIEESDFKEYAEELVKDCGYISRDFPSWIVIDWSETTDNVRNDYSEVRFRGTDYLFR